MTKKEDLRIRKTKANFYRALSDLLKEKDFSNIKVIDICKKSNLNRSTFYDHFNDKNELLESYLNYLGDDLINYLSDTSFKNNKDYYLEITKLLLDYINKNINTFKSIYKNNSNLIYDMLYNATISVVAKNIDYQFNNFYISGITRLCGDIITKDNTNLKQLLNDIANLLVNIN